MFAEILFISKAFVVAQVPGAVVGFVAGAFCPAVLRKIKAAFVAEGTKLKAEVKSGVSTAAQDVAKKL